jgi:hypothetical protein
VSLAGNALLDAGLLSTASGATAAAARFAQGILGFVQKAGHVCDVCEVFVCFGVVGDWMERTKLRGGREELDYMPWSYILEFHACVIA